MATKRKDGLKDAIHIVEQAARDKALLDILGPTTLTRDTHCTHPNQTWCDCDWCRVVRYQEAK